jgi:hypothetical protein
MYHKISSLMLNLGKSPSGYREVFVAQPDNITEKMAGKIFIIFELETKKSEAKKIMDFLINGIEEYYYQDEKIFLRDKIEGLELENIFEAFLTKLNKALTDFLIEEKIRVKSSDFNITLGLVYENQLIFSNFGRNKAYLIFRKKDQYEILNIEASASEIEIINYEDNDNESVLEKMKSFKIFSSVISGEIPSHSYFFFTNENLPEYLSTKEMVLIVSKLPPMIAVEQIKQSLAKVNTYAPFLALIIKNTFGLSEEDKKDEIIENLSAQSSISSLKNTERKTEDMLSPSGFINLEKLKSIFNSIIYFFVSAFKKIITIFKSKDRKVKQAVKKTVEQKNQVAEKKSVIDIQTKIEVFKSSSNFNKFFLILKNFVVNLFTTSYWSDNFSKFIKNFSSAHPKRKILISLTLLLFIILVVSISITNKQKRLGEHEEKFLASIESLENRFDLIDSYLLYENEDGAKIIIGEISEEISQLTALNEEQEEILKDWRNKLQVQRQNIQKMTIVDEAKSLFDTLELNSSAEPRNLLILDNILYISNPVGKIIYTYNILTEETSSVLINANFDINLNLPSAYNNQLYYKEEDSLVAINPVNGQLNQIAVPSFDNLKTNAIDIWSENGLLYSLHSTNNSILRHSPVNLYNQSNQWLQEELDLSKVIDMAVTGDIWLLENNANLIKLRIGQVQDFDLAHIDPPLNRADKLLALNNNLYIFDRQSLRLALYDYQGNFISQYQFNNYKNTFDLVVDENSNQVYLLVDTKIYSFPL